jgi:CheY-like chemotaxis protein
MQTEKIIEILLVEDNPGDIRLTREAFNEYKIANNLSVVTDGEEAMEFLNKTGRYKNAPTPDMILLDLNLPRKDGREVLEEIKESPIFKSIPVVVLSTSESDSDIRHSYEHYANCYITKPIDFNNFMKVIKQLQEFWVTIVKLPSKNPNS